MFEPRSLDLGRPGDVLIAISTSGPSPNFMRAAAAAHERGLTIVGFTGEGGSDMVAAAVCDLCRKASAAQTPLAQQHYITAAHIICGLVEEACSQGEVSAAVKYRSIATATECSQLARFVWQKWTIWQIAGDLIVTIEAVSEQVALARQTVLKRCFHGAGDSTRQRVAE